MVSINVSVRGFEAHHKEYEDKALEVLRSGWYVLGKEVSAFEEEFATFNGSKYCIGVDNGLNAIVLGIKALGIGEGDEVIVAANTYIATVFGASLNKATPVFVDADEYHNIDLSNIEKAISPKTKAVLVTHFYGQACRMKQIKEICDKHNIYLLEDCAQAHGAKNCEKKVGTWGILGFFSFYPTKNLGCFGDGGAIITDNQALNDKLRALRNYGSVKRYENDYEGYNSRLDELQAGLLRVKLKYLDKITEERRKIANRYITEITNPMIKMPKTAPDCTHVYHLFVIQVDDRDKFRVYMKEHDIATDVHYPTPPYLAKPYLHLNYKREDFPMTEYLYSRIVSIPCFTGITDEEQSIVINAINSYK